MKSFTWTKSHLIFLAVFKFRWRKQIIKKREINLGQVCPKTIFDIQLAT